jgi:hypothetical protein
VRGFDFGSCFGVFFPIFELLDGNYTYPTLLYRYRMGVFFWFDGFVFLGGVKVEKEVGGCGPWVWMWMSWFYCNYMTG